MDFRDYKKAADKHLKTCIATIDAYNNLKNSNPSALMLNSAFQQSIFHNILYLTGYTLECTIVYSIYKHFKWNPNRSVSHKDDNFSKQCDFSFHPKDGYNYFVLQHDFQRNIDVLKVPFSSSGIPFIDSGIKVSLESQYLFMLWKPDLRYHPSNKTYAILNSPIAIDETNVFNFVTTCQKFHNDLLKIVG